jgi:translation initiation factor 1
MWWRKPYYSCSKNTKLSNRVIKFMDFKDQLKNLFPDHEPSPEEALVQVEHELYVQKEPMICKFEKRNGKPTTIIEGYDGTDEDFKILAKEIKTKLSVGGSFKDNSIIIQGNYRDKIMEILKLKGFKVKRVGG